jgi:hypothetical protein
MPTKTVKRQGSVELLPSIYHPLQPKSYKVKKVGRKFTAHMQDLKAPDII